MYNESRQEKDEFTNMSTNYSVPESNTKKKIETDKCNNYFGTFNLIILE